MIKPLTMRGLACSASLSIAAVTGAVTLAACSKPGTPYSGRSSPVQIIDRSPGPGATGVAINAPIEVEFGENVDNHFVDPQGPHRIEVALGLFHSGAPVPAATPSYDPSNRLVVLTPTGVLATNTTYTVQIQGLVDAQGRAVQDTSWSFTTGSPPSATSRIAYSPAPNSIGVPLNWVIRMGFAEPLNPADVIANALSVTVAASPVPGTVSYDALADAIVFVPQAPVAVNSVVTVTLASGVGAVHDVFGRPVTVPPWSFTVTNQANGFETSVPLFASAPAGVESPAGSGNVVVTLPPASSGFWTTGTMRYAITLAQQSYVAQPSCTDPLDPTTLEVAWIGTGNVAFQGLANGKWSLVVQAENGSGTRSAPSAPLTFGVQGGAVAFASTLAPLFSLRCALAGCHAGSSPAGYVDFTQPLTVWRNQRFETSQVEVTPFCLEASYLWRKVQAGYPISGGLMPPADVDVQGLSRRQRGQIASWIEQGAQN